MFSNNDQKDDNYSWIKNNKVKEKIKKIDKFREDNKSKPVTKMFLPLIFFVAVYNALLQKKAAKFEFIMIDEKSVPDAQG